MYGTHILHEGLETIVFLGEYWGLYNGINYNPTLNLPEGLKSITLKESSTVPVTLPDGCVRLDVDIDSDSDDEE